MNQIIITKTIIFSLIFGACLGLALHIPSYTIQGLILFILLFLSPIFIILYMKNNEKHLSFIDNRQGAIMGGIIGFFTTLGTCISFIPMAYILYFINRNSYFGGMIHNFINEALWLLIVLVFITSLIFAMTNSTTGMGLAFILKFIEKKPENMDAPLDIEIND